MTGPLLSPPGSYEHVDALFARLDTDRNGCLSLSEFAAFYVAAEHEAQKAAVGSLAMTRFLELSQGLPYVTKAQFWEASLKLGLFDGLSYELAAAKVNEEFPLADVDGSGVLDAHEFCRYFRLMQSLHVLRGLGVSDMELF